MTRECFSQCLLLQEILNPWNKLCKEEPSRDQDQISLQPGISEIPVGFMLDLKEKRKENLFFWPHGAKSGTISLWDLSSPQAGTE